MTPQRILILEDEDDLRRLYVKVLAKSGYEVHSAATLQIARQLLDLHHFHVLLCDIQLGRGERGIELFRDRIEILTGQGTQIVMLSCEAQYRSVCEEIGIEFFIEKPVAIQPLITLLDRLTARPTL